MFIVYETIRNKGRKVVAKVDSDERTVQLLKEAMEAENHKPYDYVERDTWDYWKELELQE